MPKLLPYFVVHKDKGSERPDLDSFPIVQLYLPLLRGPAGITSFCIPGVQVAMRPSQEPLVSLRVLSE
jgi:hypothetical protein